MSKSWLPPINKARETFGDATFDNLHEDTRMLRSQATPRIAPSHPLTVPVYLSSTYETTSVQEYLDILKDGGYIYQRLGNPTTETAEIMINEIEGGCGTILFNSGLAAISSVFTCFLKAGDHIVCCNPVYSGTYKYISDTLTRFGIECTWVPPHDVDAYARAIRPNTKMLYGESPCNPNMVVLDIQKFASFGGSAKGILTVVDGTFASPYAQKAVQLGVDISIHSCSKYLGGHTDLIGGCATFKDVRNWQHMKVYQSSNGSTLAAFESYLLVRGIKTLPVRMDRLSATALELATFLDSHPKVARVYYPGLPSHPQHDAAKRQMRLFSGMICFELYSLESARRFVEAVRVIHLAVSLGGTESLVEHPASMTHGPMIMDHEDRLKAGITDGLIRFSVGLENVQDLKQDLSQALELA